MSSRIAAFIIFALAFLIRIYDLNLFPLNHDEATWTLGSLEHFDKFIGIPVACFQGYIRPFFSYLVFFVNKMFSRPEYIARLPSIIIGVATVILIYQLTKEMYGKKAGLISAMLLCFLPWHIIQSRVGAATIETPLFGCLIFLTLLKSIKRKNNLWFLLSWFFLAIGSFYTYQASLLFVLIFLLTLIFLRKDLCWLKLRIFLSGILIFLVILFPLIFLQITNQIPQYLGKVYRLYYQDEPLRDTLLAFFIKSLINFKNNSPPAFRALFLNSSGSILYGKALDFPLLINRVTLFIVLFSIFISFWRREASDKILLIWLGLGGLGAISGVKFFQARYIIIILVPLLIVIAKFFAEIYNYAIKKAFLKRRLLFCTGIFLCTGLIFTEVFQAAHYYQTAPFDLEECRFNSYGCKEAAQYLSQAPDIKNYGIISDSSMEPLHIYLGYYLFDTSIADGFYSGAERQTGQRKEGVYYIIWAPESHPEEYRRGEFSWLWKDFKANHPDTTPVKTIYYPNGLAAIRIFKVEDEVR